MSGGSLCAIRRWRDYGQITWGFGPVQSSVSRRYFLPCLTLIRLLQGKARWEGRGGTHGPLAVDEPEWCCSRVEQQSRGRTIPEGYECVAITALLSPMVSLRPHPASVTKLDGPGKNTGRTFWVRGLEPPVPVSGDQKQQTPGIPHGAQLQLCGVCQERRNGKRHVVPLTAAADVVLEIGLQCSLHYKLPGRPWVRAAWAPWTGIPDVDWGAREDRRRSPMESR